MRLLRVTAGNRNNYLFWLQSLHKGAHGNADLVAHFFRRAFELIRHNGVFGFIATNTIGQGDTRDTGLATILEDKGTIIRATRQLKWPGEAAVIVSVLHVSKGLARMPILNTRPVRRISAYVVEGDLDRSPLPLSSNRKKAFQGTIVLGMGFTFDDVAAAKGEAESLDTMSTLINRSGRNAERIFPYIGGEEVNSDPRHAYHRYVIDFSDFPLMKDSGLPSWASGDSRDREKWLRDGIVPFDYPGSVAADWPDLLKVVERLVKPGRQALGDKADAKHRKKFWWQFGRLTPSLYATIAGLNRVLVTSQISAYHCFAFLHTGSIFAHRLNVFAFSTNSSFAVLQSSAHEIWSRSFGYTLEDRNGYSPENCFQNFPLPAGFETSPALEAVGCAYHDHRARLMVTRNEGMTKIYNRFHDRAESVEDIGHLRSLQAEMDRAVLDAYGWHDLAVRAELIFLDETNENDHTFQGRLFWSSDLRDEVLTRLLALNAERHADEIRLGIALGMKGKRPGDEEYEAE
jgi:hypothetical protein